MESAKKLLESLWVYGVAAAVDVPPTVEDTRRAVEAVAPIMHTTFGDIAAFEANLERADTAYTSEYIGLHTDNTYWTQPAGYNAYDRAEMSTIETDKVYEVYSAYQKLGRAITEPSREFQIKLQPGTTLFIDNFRVLHARKAFDGRRVMIFAYVLRDEFLSRLKVAGVFSGL
ncbi:unnamed protein product [Darwinula stevensoni]|uniref:TauD/TfdA-like domain-containing protein n=1 Tax=Darwinula stevensoni TaxID=69355 RepID=A0A7R9AFA1_9CRUS|nr:unnamed protein product [Darwinula stevensoni]CAG0903082.1 unnamed protein product [Darwinula stevensoni]